MSAQGVLPVDAETAWAHLVRWERQPAWIADADRVRVLGAAREGVGVRISVRTRVLTLPVLTEVLEVVRWEPPTLLRIAHTGFVQGTGDWRLDPVAGGQTRFTWTEDLRLPIPVVGSIALRVYSLVLRRVMRRSVGRLASVVQHPGER